MKKLVFVLVLILAVAGFSQLKAEAQTQRVVRFKSSINPGALLTDVRDQFGKSILEPILGFGVINNSVKCQNNSNSMSQVLGSDSQRIYVDNPKAAYDGWTLTIAPEDGLNAKWQSQDSSEFDYNDGAEGGCIDSDNDGSAGLMAIDPSNAKINSDCLECSKNHITVGSVEKQSFSEHQSVTLLKANGQADELGSWYMTGIDVEQTIPPGQEGGNYIIDMVLTATAT